MYESSRLEPRQLQALFEKNLALLLEVFNPQGWCVQAAVACLLACLLCVSFADNDGAVAAIRLELTYVDEAHRVGRDDKGYTFVLERAAEADA